MNFLNQIKESFMSHSKGFSARKMTAFVVTLLIVYTHYKWLRSCYNNNHFDLLPQVLLIDFSALLCLLGLTTWEKISSLKSIASGSYNSNNSNNSNNSGGGNGPSINVDLSQKNTNTNSNNNTASRKRRRRKPNNNKNN